MHLERSGFDAETAFDVVRRLGFQLKGPRNEERSAGDAFIDGRSAERARGAAKHREYVVEPVLEPDVQGVLRLVAVERKRLGAECEWSRPIEAVPRAKAGVLHAGAIGEIRCRQRA